MYKKILIGIAAILITTTVAAAQKQYKLLGEPRVGSKFRPVEVMSPIPFDKNYQQLSDEQKEIFRSFYGGLKDSEQPPFPKDGTKTIYEPIIEAHDLVARGGTLFLIAMINEKGKVENVAVYESPADKITEIATAVLFNTEFDPATCDGSPCKMEFPFEFNLRNKEKVIRN